MSRVERMHQMLAQPVARLVWATPPGFSLEVSNATLDGLQVKVLSLGHRKVTPKETAPPPSRLFTTARHRFVAGAQVDAVSKMSLR